MPPTPHLFFPLWLDLENEPVLVVGAGKVAFRRVGSLIPCRPSLHVVAPHVLPDFSDLYNEGVLKLSQRCFEEKDLEEQRLVFACTDDSVLNRFIVAKARERGIWAEGCTGGSSGNMHPGSLVRRGGLAIAISSSGVSPLLTRGLRECLEDLFGMEWETLVEDMARVRSAQNPSGHSGETEWEARITSAFKESIQRYLNHGDPVTKAQKGTKEEKG